MKIDVFCVLIAYKKELRAKRCYALAVCCIFRLSYMHSWWTYVVAWLWSLDLHNNHSISLPSPFWKEFEFWNFCEQPLQWNVQIVLFALRCGQKSSMIARKLLSGITSSSSVRLLPSWSPLVLGSNSFSSGHRVTEGKIIWTSDFPHEAWKSHFKSHGKDLWIVWCSTSQEFSRGTFLLCHKL